ncbi:MAG: TIGR00300 family protein [Planctomycetota bacterium]
MKPQEAGKPEPAGDDRFPYFEETELSGHIIDSLLLPKVLDCILTAGGRFKLKNISIGEGRSDPSRVLIEVHASDEATLRAIVAQAGGHGAVPTAGADAHLVVADLDGAFPEGFYATTNQRTEVRLAGQWLPVADPEMDCGILVDTDLETARCVAMSDVVRGSKIVVGYKGVRVHPYQRPAEDHGFAFMNSNVSTEKPKGVVIRQVAERLFENKQRGEKTLLVGGPAIVHTGSGALLTKLITGGYIHKLFAGNALATHDIEQALYGTSLGVNLHEGSLADAGHEHHLRAINRIRRAGSIAAAVKSGVLTSGIMHACIDQGVEFLLSGSIRDDGPLPDVVTDAIENQRLMRAAVRDVSFCLMIATTLHSIAVGNLLPAEVGVVCVDINPSTVIKLSDRGSFQTVGLVTDVEPFLRAVVNEIEALEQQEAE